MDTFGTSATLGHTALDAAGFIPGVGMLFDGMNALWYLAQGDWTNASLSAIAVIPLVGGITSGTKIAVKTVKAADELADAAKVAEKTTNEVIEGAGSTRRAVANSLSEQLAMEQVKSNPLAGAIKLPIKLKDTRWSATDGWIKMQNVVETSEGKITIHFNYNINTGATADFKFK